MPDQEITFHVGLYDAAPLVHFRVEADNGAIDGTLPAAQAIELAKALEGIAEMCILREGRELAGEAQRDATVDIGTIQLGAHVDYGLRGRGSA